MYIQYPIQLTLEQQWGWYYLQCISLETSKTITPNEYFSIHDFLPDLLGL